MRTKLRQADALLRTGRLAEALVLYDQVAGELEQGGFVLKAIAVARQVVEVAERSAEEQSAAREAALRRLVRLYEQLGLAADSAEAERLLRAGRKNRLD